MDTSIIYCSTAVDFDDNNGNNTIAIEAAAAAAQAVAESAPPIEEDAPVIQTAVEKDVDDEDDDLNGGHTATSFELDSSDFNVTSSDDHNDNDDDDDDNDDDGDFQSAPQSIETSPTNDVAIAAAAINRMVLLSAGQMAAETSVAADDANDGIGTLQLAQGIGDRVDRLAVHDDDDDDSDAAAGDEDENDEDGGVIVNFLGKANEIVGLINIRKTHNMHTKQIL